MTDELTAFNQQWRAKNPLNTTTVVKYTFPIEG